MANIMFHAVNGLLAGVAEYETGSPIRTHAGTGREAGLPRIQQSCGQLQLSTGEGGIEYCTQRRQLRSAPPKQVPGSKLTRVVPDHQRVGLESSSCTES